MTTFLRSTLSDIVRNQKPLNAIPRYSTVLKKHGDGFARLLDAHTEDNECLVVNTYPVECDVAEAIDCHPCSIPKESSQVQKRSSLFSHVMTSVG